MTVRISQPDFSAQTKNKLTSPIESEIYNTTFAFLTQYWETHPKVAKAIIHKSIIAAQARLQAARARKSLVIQKGFNKPPTKLRDCTASDPSQRELYLVEGDSAGGSAEGGRDRRTQAILPLRGKIVNALKLTDAKVLGNEEVKNIIAALGMGVGNTADLSRLRYHKVIIMSDADVDGSHIRTLLLCLLYRQMFPLVQNGHVYIAQPPLFRIRSRNANEYLQDTNVLRNRLIQNGVSRCKLFIDGNEFATEKLQDAANTNQLPKLLADIGSKSMMMQSDDGKIPVSREELLSKLAKHGEKGLQITRFKGLGEMNAEELRETTLHPAKRKLLRVTIEDATYASQIFEILMGQAVGERRKFIQENAQFAVSLDI